MFNSLAVTSQRSCQPAIAEYRTGKWVCLCILGFFFLSLPEYCMFSVSLHLHLLYNHHGLLCMCNVQTTVVCNISTAVLSTNSTTATTTSFSPPSFSPPPSSPPSPPPAHVNPISAPSLSPPHLHFLDFDSTPLLLPPPPAPPLQPHQSPIQLCHTHTLPTQPHAHTQTHNYLNMPLLSIQATHMLAGGANEGRGDAPGKHGGKQEALERNPGKYYPPHRMYVCVYVRVCVYVCVCGVWV